MRVVDATSEVVVVAVTVVGADVVAGDVLVVVTREVVVVACPGRHW